ncbi:MAG TPA: hypothetical protein DCZ95_16615, partial [Verrucomicrobia bacterium]|nr:hypothetical protein [Verrucomicrobiota bacterium]
MVIDDILNGSRPGNFGWLTWAGSPSVPTLVKSLTPPGDSYTYVNPDRRRDHDVSVGDWVNGKAGLSNSRHVRRALDVLKTIDIAVPVWNQIRGHGHNHDYRVVAFARLRILSYDLSGQNRITARFLGYAGCEQTNRAPVVKAGPDQVITNPSPALLSGTMTDDGLPSGGVLKSWWSKASGTGDVTFASSNALQTLASFSAAGHYILQLTGSDSQLTNSDTVEIVANDPNHPPQALPQSITVDEDGIRIFSLQGMDADGDPLSYSIDLPPSYGMLAGEFPQISYRPIADYHGPDSFTFKVHDGQLESAPAQVAITVLPVNDAPMTDSQSITNVEDHRFQIVLSGADLEGSFLTYRIVRPPVFGVLSEVSSNRVHYTPAPDYGGLDSFDFVACDNELCSTTATVSLVILAVNDAPVAREQTVTINEDATAIVTLEGYDVEGDELEYAVLGPPENGALNGSVPNLIYTPSLNFYGTNIIAFTVNDGILSSRTATVTVTVHPVNDAPMAEKQALATREDEALGIVLTATDVERDNLTFTVVDTPANGWLMGAAPNYVYIPATNFHGVDSFTFKAHDEFLDSAPTAVSIDVQSVNDAPTADAGADQLVDEPRQALLAGRGSDDDGSSETLSYAWSKLSGPGEVVFADSTASNTTASFGAAGIYVLLLTVSDGDLSAADTLTVSVNAAPTVQAGPERIVEAPAL